MSPREYFALERSGNTLVAMPGRNISSLPGPELLKERSAFVEEVRKPDVHSVVVDFQNVDHFGSLMLDTLCVAWTQVRKRGGTMALCNVSPVGQEILARSRLNSVWPVYPSRQHAVEGVRAAPVNETSSRTSSGEDQQDQ